MKALLQESPFEELFGFQLKIIDLIGPEKIKNKGVLDIGCGFGWFERQAIQYKVKKITGIDVLPETIAIAKKLNNKSVTFIQGSAIELPFKDNSFDTVVSWEVLEHIPVGTEPQMMKEVFRVLKPGGFFCFSTQHANPISTILDPAWWLAGHRHYNTTTIVNFITSVPFLIHKIYHRGGVHNMIHPINLYSAKWIFRREPFFKDYFYRKLTEEFSTTKGFTNIISICQKGI